MDKNVQLQEKFEQIFEYKTGISNRTRLENGLKHICKNLCNSEDVLTIIDTSIFKNGKSGVVLGVDGIYVKDATNHDSKFNARYEDMIDVSQCGKKGLQSAAVIMSMRQGNAFRIDLEEINLGKMKDFLEFAMNLYARG